MWGRKKMNGWELRNMKRKRKYPFDVKGEKRNYMLRRMFLILRTFFCKINGPKVFYG